MKQSDLLYAIASTLSNIDWAIENAHHLGCEEALEAIATELKTGSYDDLLYWLDDKEVEDLLRKEPEPVDLYVLIDSGIDCSRFDTDGYEPLNDEWSEIDLADLGVRPRTNYWFSEHNFKGNAGHVACTLEGAGFVLEYDRDDSQWTAFRITGLQDGYCWPGECDK